MANYEKMITYKSYAGIYDHLQVSFLTTLVCILMGYPLAYFMAQLSDRMAVVCMFTVLLPFGHRFWSELMPGWSYIKKGYPK